MRRSSLLWRLTRMEGRRRSAAAGASEQAETTAWVGAVVSAGGTVSAGRRTLVDTLIAGLKTDGVWTKLDRLWLLAAENSQSALIDLVSAATATAQGGPSFTADLGYTGVDASSTVYIDTGFNPSTAGSPKYTQNSAHLSVWSNTNAASGAAGGSIIGLISSDNSVQTNIFPKYNDGNTYSRINDTPASGGTANANSTGHYIANRSGAAASQEFRNGSSIATPNANSGAVQNGNFYLLAHNKLTIGAELGGAYQVTMASIGGSLTGVESSFYNRLRTYMTAVGVP